MNQAFATFFARVILGLIFFMAGCWKVFSLGPIVHARRFFLPASDSFLPVWSLWTAGVLIPFLELAAGFLLIVGFRIRESLVVIGLILITVTFGHLLTEPLFSPVQHIIPRLALLLYLLSVPAAWDRFSLDAFLKTRKNEA